MLLEFKIRNFRSIREELTLSMMSSGRLGKKDLPDNVALHDKFKAVKSLVLYGRNASGKSNVILAILALQNIVSQSDKFRINERIPVYEPFLLDDEYINKPVMFAIDFIGYDNNRYNYLIEFNSDEILKEELFFYPNGVKSKLYKRDGLELSYGDYFSGNRKSIENELLKNQLFLSKSSTMRFKYLNEVYSSIIAYVSVMKNQTDFDRGLPIGMTEDKTKRMNSIINLLKNADTNIHDFKLIRQNAAESHFAQSFLYSVHEDEKPYWSFEKINLKTMHPVFRNGQIVRYTDFDFTQESSGTKKLFGISYQLLTCLDNGGILFVDELDQSLHPLLTRMLIGLFHNPETNPKNAQLIFATHDSYLLDSELFRRDQIGFVEKGYEGNSELYRLSDIKGVRKDIPIDKWYLSGRFGAIPVIGDFSLK